MRASGQLDGALEVARSYADDAADALDGVAGSEAGAALIAASDYLIEAVRVAGGR